MSSSRDSRLTMELWALAFALPPLMVWLASQLTIELVGIDSISVLQRLHSLIDSASEPEALKLARARLDWSAGLILFYTISIAVLVYATILLNRQLSRAGRIVYILIALVLIGFLLSYAIFSAEQRNAFSLLFYFSWEALERCQCLSSDVLGRIEMAVSLLNLLAIVVPPIALLAGCSSVIPPLGNNREVLANLGRNMARLKIVLAGGSALLVAGLLHQILWHRWPAALLSGASENEVIAMASSLAIYWGGTYSLLAVAFFLPPAMVMGQRARTILESDPGAAGEGSAREWLEANGFSNSPMKQLPQIAAMMAPLLAGSLGSDIPNFGQAFTLS